MLLFALLGGVAVVLVLLLRGSPQQTEDPEHVAAVRPDRGETSDQRPVRFVPRITRPVPRFVQSSVNAQRPNTIHGDFMSFGTGREAAAATFDRQARDQGWAPRMERHLRDRLDPTVFDRLGLHGLALQIGSVECRHYGCQIQVDWSMDVRAGPGGAPFPPDGSPIRYLNDNERPLGVALMRHTREQERNRRMRETFFVFYRDDVREPDAWPGAASPGGNQVK